MNQLERRDYLFTFFMCFLISGVISVLFVRGFFFDNADNRLWNIIWAGVLPNNLFISAMFAKVVSSFVIGGLFIASILIGVLYEK